MNLEMDPLCDPLTTRPIQMGWEFTMELYPSGQFGSIDNSDRQFGNRSVWTRTQTRSDGPEPLLTLDRLGIRGRGCGGDGMIVIYQEKSVVKMSS
jgi:hypothetical protein